MVTIAATEAAGECVSSLKSKPAGVASTERSMVGTVVGATLGTSGCHSPGSYSAASSICCSSGFARAEVRMGSAKNRSSSGTRK